MPGDRGPDVAALQRQLNRHAAAPISQGVALRYDVPVDGSFDPADEGAVRWFQAVQRLPTTGLIDAETRTALRGPPIPPR